MNIKDYDISIALLHYPIKSKTGEIITTAVTNLDVHDIARISATFGIKNYYIVTPIQEQQALVTRIVSHWLGDYGSGRNPSRNFAMSKIIIKKDYNDCILDIKEKTGKEVVGIATSARYNGNVTSFADLTKTFVKEKSYILVFGTGYGLDDNFFNNIDYVLERIDYQTGYNHLPVRSAVSIILDRLYNEFVKL